VVNGYQKGIKIVVCAGVIMAIAFGGMIPSNIETVGQVGFVHNTVSFLFHWQF